jgi:hypothetical protein
MDTNLVDIVKHITMEHGEAVLNDPQRLKAFFSDLAKDEPKPLRIAFGRCVEAGAYTALKTTHDSVDRAECKAAITQRLRDEHGLDVTLCGEALDILEAALFADIKVTPRCASCGGELREEWKLCPFCGMAISAKLVEAPTALPIPPVTHQSSAEEEQIPNDVSNERLRLTASIISIISSIVFGGVIGSVIIFIRGDIIGVVIGSLVGVLVGGFVDGRKRSKS